MIRKKSNFSVLSLVFASFLFTNPAHAEYSPWMKIRKIESYGKVLAKRKMVPTKIECKRGPGRIYWRNTLLRLKLVPESKMRITSWKVYITKTYEGGISMSRQAKNYYHHRMVVPPGPSGISAHCGIIFNTKTKKNFSTKKRWRR